MKQQNLYRTVILLALFIIGAMSVIISKEERYGHWMLHRYQHYFAPQEEFLRKSQRRDDYWCIQGWTNTLQKLNIDCDICFFGHSQIVPIDYQEYYTDKKIVTLGYRGDDVDGMLLRVEQVKCVKPEKVFFMSGINSIWCPDDEFIGKYEKVIDSINSALPNVKIYAMNILPECDGEVGKSSMNERICQRNKIIADYCARKGLTLVDLYPVLADEKGNLKQEVSLDGLHINEMGYDILRRELDKYITE